jgi:hypothetical protein
MTHCQGAAVVFVVALLLPVNLAGQEELARTTSERKSGTYLKVGLAQWQGDIFSKNSLTNWDVDLFGTNFELRSVKLSVESYFRDTLMQLSGFSVGYRKDNLHRSESGHMMSLGLFRDIDVKVFAVKTSAGVEWGMPSFSFDQTELRSGREGVVRYHHAYIYRNADIPFVGTSTDGVVYPFIEVSVLQRPWGLLFETGMRVGFPRFNLDDYEVSPRDFVGYALNRKRVIVPYVFAQFGVRVF